ncbi:hypothetical protein HDV05_000666, partial [Chytridiales sp. JEL 0842]
SERMSCFQSFSFISLSIIGINIITFFSNCIDTQLTLLVEIIAYNINTCQSQSETFELEEWDISR